MLWAGFSLATNATRALASMTTLTAAVCAAVEFVAAFSDEAHGVVGARQCGA